MSTLKSCGRSGRGNLRAELPTAPFTKTPARPGKSEFPEGWDDSKIKDVIQSVAADPGSTVTEEREGRLGIRNIREGVKVLVIVEGPTNKNYGNIVTAYPPELPKNPRKK